MQHRSAVVDEFGGAEFGDVRRTRRLERIAEMLNAQPSSSFPAALVSTADLEAGYRFFNNSAITPAAIQAPHRRNTWMRAQNAPWLLSLEDTSEMRYGGGSEREGLGPLFNGGHGFYFHPALLVSLDEGAERPIPLGVATYEVLVRTPKPKRPWREAYADPEKESLRWDRVMRQVDEDAAAHGCSIIHVADREATQYELLANCRDRGGRFIIRLRQGFLDRSERGESFSATLHRSVLLPPKSNGRSHRRKGSERAYRTAKLVATAAPVTIPTPAHVDRSKHLGLLNLVEIVELDPPADVEPVQWTLLTTEKTDTPEDLARIIDSYRARWQIEEFFKALKTGCSFEDRQLESLAALENALAVFVPIAWQILLLRSVARDAPDTPAAQVVSPSHADILSKIANGAMNPWKIRLSAEPTAKELIYAIARMGGHLPRNGTPGWITVRRGLDTLFRLEQAAELFSDRERCDQS